MMSTRARRAHYAAAVFDMDGLLLDSERPIRDAWLRAALELDIALLEADYLLAVGANATDSRRVLCAAVGGERQFEAIDQRARLHLGAQRETGFAVKAGALELLHVLGGMGIVCCVASSTARAEVGRRLQASGLRDHFVAITGGDEVVRGKPQPDLFLLAGERIGIEACRCLVFEDSELGARGALAAGMGVVLVPDLKIPDPAVCAAATMVLHSLADAVPLCPGWFAP